MNKLLILITAILSVFLLSNCSGYANNEIKGYEKTQYGGMLRVANFEHDWNRSEETGKTDIYTGNLSGVSYNVSFYNSDCYGNGVESVTISAIKQYPEANFDFSLFTSMVEGVKEECDLQTAYDWVAAHFNNPSDTIIGNIHFNMLAPTQMVRNLRFTKVMSKQID